jgi:hypothetical protein
VQKKGQSAVIKRLLLLKISEGKPKGFFTKGYLIPKETASS